MAKYKSITGLITEPIATAYHKIPSVSTANLPGAGVNAHIPATNSMLVYNTTLEMLQQYSAGSWQGIASAPTISSFVYSDGAAATAEKTVVGLVSISCTTQTSTTVLVPGASLGIEIGMVVAGTGIVSGTTVVSVIEDTSFVISAAATASATVTLTFGGKVTITGTGFDSILAGGAANIAVTFDGTTATSIGVNAAKTIITCTPPAHAAGTITLQVKNASGLIAETDFIYDIEPVFTTAAGSIGSFVDGAYTGTPDGTYPRIQATENSVALTSGFARVTSATDNTVITTALQGLTLQGTGYWTGTLSATEGTTYPFYAIATDDEGQKTAPRLFNIISRHPDPTGGTISTILSGSHKMHVFLFAQTGTNFNAGNITTVDVLVVAGGGAGGSSNYAGAGGAGGLLYFASETVTVGTNYLVTVGEGGQTQGADGGDSTFAGLTTCNGGGGAGAYGGGLTGYNNGKAGGSGGGAGVGSWAGSNGSGGAVSPAGQGNIGGGGYGSGGQSRGGGGGGKGGAATTSPGAYVGGVGWDGSSYFGTGVGDSGWFASGGGGAWGDGITTNGGVNTSPIGGGGNGGTQGGGSSQAAQAGADGTGGGGGCGATSNSVQGQDGGDGVVIIRYAV